MSILSSWRKRKQNKELKDIIKHTKHILHVNDDILTKSVKQDVATILEEAEAVDTDNPEEVQAFNKQAPARILKTLPQKNYPTLREYADILAVALCVAFGVRALFLQPFKIPTSSMQPTLFGIHYIKNDNTLPNLPAPLHYMLYSTQRAKCTIKQAGTLNPKSVYTTNKYIMFPWTHFNIAGINYSLPGTPAKIQQYSSLSSNEYYSKGDTLCDGWLSLGDHLFVDRFTYHFREPQRGDVLVFNTENIKRDNNQPLAGYYYIKRLIALPGDTIKLVDSMIYIKPEGAEQFEPITKFNPAFNKIYSAKGGYQGHVVGQDSRHLTSPSSLFTVPEDSYFALGDNSANSLDSRYWGVVPRKNLIGRGYFVFWPFSRRWGFVDSTPPLDRPTSLGLPSMQLQ